jgi:hypothetical protein
MKNVVTVGYIDIKVIYISHKCCVRKWTGIIDGVNIGNYVSEYVSQIDLSTFSYWVTIHRDRAEGMICIDELPYQVLLIHVNHMSKKIKNKAI